MTFNMLEGRTQNKQIQEALYFAVPERTLLLFFKLKAAWDRNYRLTNGSSRDISWETEKVRKDRADIIALLDPNAGGQNIDINYLGNLLSTYPFLFQALELVPSQEAVDMYNGMGNDRMSFQEVKDVVESLMRLLR